MNTAGGETVELTRSSSGIFGRLTVSLHRIGQSAFLTADQLRDLARECESLARELEADTPA